MHLPVHLKIYTFLIHLEKAILPVYLSRMEKTLLLALSLSGQSFNLSVHETHPRV